MGRRHVAEPGEVCEADAPRRFDDSDDVDLSYDDLVHRIEQEHGRSPAFDARALLAQRRNGIIDPVYGRMPFATVNERARIEASQLEARGRRLRRKRQARIAVATLVVGAVVGGWVVRDAYRRDQQRWAVARTEASERVERDGDPSALIDVLSGASVGRPTIAEILPDELLDASVPAVPIDGIDRYVVDAAAFESASPRVYSDWLDRWQDQPRLDPSDPMAALVPTVDDGEIGIAIRLVDDQPVDIGMIGRHPDLSVGISP